MKLTLYKRIDKVCVGFHDSIKGPLPGYCMTLRDPWTVQNMLSISTTVGFSRKIVHLLLIV